MADPFVGPAVVGGAVSKLYLKALESFKDAVRLKESCETLKSKVDGILPLLTGARAQSGDWDPAAIAWAKNLEDILRDADKVANQIIEESKYETVVRFLKTWKWYKLSKRVNKISDRIDEARSNAPFILLCINRSRAPRATSSGAQLMTTVQVTTGGIVTGIVLSVLGMSAISASTFALGRYWRRGDAKRGL